MKRHASSCSEKSRRIDPQVKVKRHASSEWGSAMGPWVELCQPSGTTRGVIAAWAWAPVGLS